MQLGDKELQEIEDSLVSATLQPDTWPATVARIVKSSGARGAAALPLRGRVPGVPLSPSCEDLIATYFDTGWAERDHRAKGIPKLMQTGLFVDQDISTSDFVRSSSFYNDFLGRLGFRWFAGLLVQIGDDAWCLTLQRTPEQGPFTPDEQAALRRMIAPLSRTARFAGVMGDARLRSVADTLQALRVAGLLLDRTGRVIQVNALAENLLGRDLDVTSDGLEVRGNRRATAAIRSHISAAIWFNRRPDDPALSPVIVQRVGRQPLIVFAQPLRKAGLEYLDGARAILTIKDLGAATSSPRRLLKDVYGLTPRENDLCEILLSGLSISESADRLGMTVLTARTHLKRIMIKTDTNRQSELMILISRLSEN